MADISGTEDSFAHVLEDKVVKLANNIKSLQQIVKDAEQRARLSEKKVRDVLGNLDQAEREKNEAVMSLSSLRTKFELEKETFLGKIQTYVDQIEWVREDSKKSMETVMREHSSNIASMEVKIEGLKSELEISQKECAEAKVLLDTFKKKTDIVQEELEKESEARKNAEEVAASMISKLEDEMSRKLTELHLAKEKELRESEQSFKELENVYHDQSKTLMKKEDLIGKYEEERESLSKIAKLGLTVAGEQTKESVNKISERGRSLARRTASRGRSFVSRSRSRSVKKSKSKSKNRGREVEDEKPTVENNVIEIRTAIDKSPSAEMEELKAIEEDLKQIEAKESALMKYKKELAARLERRSEHVESESLAIPEASVE